MITIATATATSTASPAEFFARWIDHDTWTEWSPDVAWVTIDGEVAQGARGVLKPTRGPKTRFFISALETDREYTDTSKLPGATLVFRHLVEPAGSGSSLFVEVTLDGPLARVWKGILGADFERSVPADLEKLVSLVEAAHVASPHA